MMKTAARVSAGTPTPASTAPHGGQAEGGAGGPPRSQEARVSPAMFAAGSHWSGKSSQLRTDVKNAETCEAKHAQSCVSLGPLPFKLDFCIFENGEGRKSNLVCVQLEKG